MNDNDDVDAQEGDIPFEQNDASNSADELHADGLDDVKAQCVEVDMAWHPLSTSLWILAYRANIVGQEHQIYLFDDLSLVNESIVDDGETKVLGPLPFSSEEEDIKSHVYTPTWSLETCLNIRCDCGSTLWSTINLTCEALRLKAALHVEFEKDGAHGLFM